MCIRDRISIVYPREGTSTVADGCAVIKGAEHEENAKLFVDFIVSTDVQRLAVEKLYRRTVRDDITPDQKEEGSIMDFDQMCIRDSSRGGSSKLPKEC